MSTFSRSSRHSSRHTPEKYEIQIPKPTSTLVYGGMLTFFGGLLLLFAFASPYWLVSWDYTFSPFKNMGLWEFCFDNYRHPNYQFDKLFSGCHYVFSEEYRIIREWLLPGWLMTVQAFFTLAFMSSFGTQFLLALLVMRWPLKHVLRNERFLTVCCGIGNLAATALLFLTISIFGGNCYRRDWIQYPNFNYLSWAFAFAVGSMFVHALAALALYKEAKDVKERQEMEGEGSLALQMGEREIGTSNPASETHHY